MPDTSLATCSSCGARLPRAEMFGIEPELQCPACAQNIRKRTNVRFRPLAKDRPPIVTVVSLVICVGIFLAATGSRHASSTRSSAWLAAIMQGWPIWKGEVWRHLTCVFIHLEWWHILMNGMALWSLGRPFEAGYGPWRSLFVLLLTGISGSALAWTMNATPNVGISGALFGLCGFFWAQRRFHPVAAAVMTDQLRNWILTLLVLGIILSQTGTLAISNWGHAGGLASGYALGWAFAKRQRWLLVPGITLVVAGLVVASVFLALGDSGWIDTTTGKPIPAKQLRKAYLDETP